MNNEKRNPLIALLAGGGGGGGSSLLVARAEISAEALEQGGEIPLTLDKTYAQLAEAGVNSAIDLAVMMDMGSGEQQIGSIWCQPVFAQDMEAFGMQLIAYTGDISFMGMTAFVEVGRMEGLESATLVLSETGDTSDIVRSDLFIWLSQSGGVWTANTTFDDIKDKFNGSGSQVTMSVGYPLSSDFPDNFFADTWMHNTNDPDTGAEIIRISGSYARNGKLLVVEIVAQNLNGTKTVTVDVDVRDITTPFVLHGTLTSETTGTVTESISDLLAAVEANREIILEFAMDGETIRMSMPTRAISPSGNNTHVSVANLFKYSPSISTHYMVNVAVYSNEGFTSLVMGATYFTATPVT